MKTKIKNRKTVGLALGSGAFRGLAHIGVLKSLIKHNIPIDYLSGASIGALVAAHYAVNRDIKKLENDIAAHSIENLPMFFDFSLTGGFIGGHKINGVLEKSLKHHNFSDLPVPLKIVATDLVSGQPYVFDSGDVARAVRASISVPLVFKPVPYKGRLCVDGGLSNPIPCNLVRGMGADIIIGVNLYHQNEFVDRKFTMSKVVLRSLRIVLHNLAKADIKGANIAICPDASSIMKKQGLGKYFTTGAAAELIKIGEQATDGLIPKIKKLLAE